MYQPSMKERKAGLEADKAVPEERLAAAPGPPGSDCTPTCAVLYREKAAAPEEGAR